MDDHYYQQPSSATPAVVTTVPPNWWPRLAFLVLLHLLCLPVRISARKQYIAIVLYCSYRYCNILQYNILFPSTGQDVDRIETLIVALELFDNISKEIQTKAGTERAPARGCAMFAQCLTGPFQILNVMLMLNCASHLII